MGMLKYENELSVDEFSALKKGIENTISHIQNRLLTVVVRQYPDIG
jgi:hypothetical protein